jgi:hypothetical protein
MIALSGSLSYFGLWGIAERVSFAILRKPVAGSNATQLSAGIMFWDLWEIALAFAFSVPAG